MEANTNYCSFLLRLWRDGADHPWRASLQSTATEETAVFADLPTLVLFLVSHFLVDAHTLEPINEASLPDPVDDPRATPDE